ncbi:MAG TPA: endonuclease/exonuclease/phosphatase family protein, partial [Polyangiaceae bacterium]
WHQVITARYSDEYPYMLFHAMTGSEGLGVLSKFPIEDLGFLLEVHGWHPAWHVQIDMPMGPVQMLDTHLRSLFRGESNALSSYLSTSDDHLGEIEGFTAFCKPGQPTLVLGDFNESPDGEAVGYLEAPPRGFQNALPLYHPGQPTWHDPPAWQMEETIDHIFFNSQFDSLNSWVLNGGNSDHLPVLAHLEEAPP